MCSLNSYNMLKSLEENVIIPLKPIQVFFDMNLSKKISKNIINKCICLFPRFSGVWGIASMYEPGGNEEP